MNTAQQLDTPDYVNRFRPSQAEIDRRYRNVRAAMEQHGLDALIISGSEYSGFEGAIRYMAGFHILHRYAYVVITPARKNPMKKLLLCATPWRSTSRAFSM